MSQSSADAGKVVRRAIAAYGGKRQWQALEGLEITMTVESGGADRVVKDPARVQMTAGSAPQIRIYFRNEDQTFALGDQGPWGLIRGRTERSELFVTRVRFTTTMYEFFFSLPFSLTRPGVVFQGVKEEVWGGEVFDTVAVGFAGGSYPYLEDTMTVWFKRSNGLVDRCFFVSTGKGWAFGDPPNYIWVHWRNHESLEGIPFARQWTFHQSDNRGAVKDKLFDVHIEEIASHRLYLPVLFREPILALPIRPPSATPAVTPKPPVIIPKP